VTSHCGDLGLILWQSVFGFVMGKMLLGQVSLRICQLSFPVSTIPPVLRTCIHLLLILHAVMSLTVFCK